MRVEFRITSGSRAGQREVFEQGVIAVGRHPSNDLRFDLEKDPDVSSKHAEIRVAGERVTLKDLGSTNGTYVNGEQIHGERQLQSGDVISFGTSGPRAEFILVGTGAAPAATRVGAVSPAHGTPVVGSAGGVSSGPPRRDTTARVAEAVEAQTGVLRKMILGLAALVVVGVGTAFWLGNRGSAEAKSQVTALLHQNDSLAKLFDRTVGQMRGKSAGVDSALLLARRESDDLRRRLQDAAKAGNSADVAAIAAEMQTSASRQRGLMSSAQVDWEAVAAQNAPALMFLAIDLGEEGLVSGTGFNVSPSGLIVTNRHVVQDSKGRPAVRLAGKFEKSDGGYRKLTVVKLSQTDELAWLKIEGGGTFPTVQGVSRAPSVRVGAPVALIGYPLGTGTAGMGGDINKLKPLSTLTVGTASKVLGDTLQLDVYAAQGSSGSPVFNAQGLVIAVLFGSPTESNGRIIYAVPSARLAAQMPPEGAAIVKQ